MDNKIKFQGLGGLGVLGSLAGTEKALVMTGSGPKLAPVGLLGGGGGGGGAGSIVPWDTSVTEAIDFTIVAQTNFENPERFMTPTIDNVAHTITQAVPVGDEELVAFVIDGGLPRTGKHWFSIAIDFNDMSYNNWTNFYISSYTDAINIDSYNVDLMVEIAGTDIFMRDRAGQQNVSQSPSVQKVMLAIDIDAGTIGVYVASGLVRTVNVAAVNGVPGLAGKLLVASMSNYAGMSETLAFNFDPAQSPYAPPVGYSPLQMHSAVLASGSEGDFMIASIDSQYHLTPLRAGYSYYVSAEQDLLPAPAAGKVAVTNLKNVFSADQQFGDDGYFTFYMTSSYVQYHGPGNFFYGEKVSPIIGNFESAGGIYQHWSHGKSGYANLAIGNGNFGFGDVFYYLTEGSGNVGVGRVGNNMVRADNNALVGNDAAVGVKSAFNNVIMGQYAGGNNGYNYFSNVMIGHYAFSSFQNDPNSTAPWTEIYSNVAIGQAAMAFTNSAVGSYNTAVGANAMGNGSAALGTQNTALGHQAGGSRIGNGDYNVWLGTYAGSQAKAGDYNFLTGYQAGRQMQGSNNILMGYQAGYMPSGVFTDVIAIGRATLGSMSTLSNVVALGANATVTGSNQVQLGDSATTTYAYGAVQSRSDARDKADVRDTRLGLQFIRELRPVDYRWDLRDDYIDLASAPQAPQPIRSRPIKPQDLRAKQENESDEQYTKVKAVHEAVVADFIADDHLWLEEKVVYDRAMDTYRQAAARWQYDNAFNRIAPDGTHKRSRFHHGFLAQDVKAVADKLGVDFAGYQDHARSGGQDVKSLGYEEFISPMVRAIQEIDKTMFSEEYTQSIVQRVMKEITTPQVLDLIAAKVLEQMSRR